MEQLVVDMGNIGHFVPPEKIRASILEKKITFEQLKKDIRALNTHPFEIVQEKK